MKNRFFFALIACFVLFFVSCLDNDVSLPDSQMKDAVQARSLSTNSEHYYYYEGRKIPLNVHPAKRYVVVKHDALTSVATLAINTTQDTYYVSENQRGYIVDIDTTEIANVFTNVNTLDLLAEDDNVLAIEYVIGDSILTPVSNKFYVKLKKLSDISLLEKYAEAIGCKVEGSIASDDYWIRLSSDKGAIFNSVEASNFIYETGDFDDIDPGFIFNFQPCSAPIDTYYNSQWNMHGTYGIGAEQAWNVTKGNASITVAVVDKGISMNHEDFVGRMHSYVYNCDEDNNIPKIYEPHGTIVAGVIAANHNNIGIAGVAPNIKLMNVCTSLSGSIDNISEKLANGINKAWLNGADIINCSWSDKGGALYNKLYSSCLNNAITSALTNGRNGKGCVVAFTAGNDYVVGYPATYVGDILVVGATNQYGNLYDRSGVGNVVDVVAPGVNIYSSNLNNEYGTFTGTSVALPHASGLAALILSLNSNLTQNQVNTIIKETACNKTWSQSYGWGIINAARALQVVQGNYSINTAYPGSGSTTYAQQAKFYIPNLPASASVQWSTNSSAATIKSCSNDTVVFEYNFASRTMTDNVNATISYCGMTSQHTLPITITNDPLITNVERIFFYDPATDRVDFKVSCTDPDATFVWSGSDNLIDFPYANDAMFMDHPNWYKSLMVPAYGVTYNLSVTASNQYGFHAYNFDYTHYPRTDMMTIEEEQEYEQEKQEEEQQ